MLSGGKLTLQTNNKTVHSNAEQINNGEKPGEYVTFSITDTGVGIDENVKPHLFEQFFTTKGRAEATGLGLSSVYGTVMQCKGFITVESAVGKGATFKIYIPSIGEPMKISDSVSKPGTQNKCTETILLVEDEESLRRVARRILERDGYTVLEAAHPQAALDLLNEYQKPIDLLLTDILMPQMNGLDLADQILTERNRIKVLYMSGYVNFDEARLKKIEQDSCFLQKPISADTLSQKVRQILDRSLPFI